MMINRVRRMTGNFASLLTSEMVNRATTFVLYALVARYLGAFEFGQLSLALTLFFITQVLAGVGLKTLVTREVARDRTKTGQYLVNSSATVVACSVLAMTALLFFVRLMSYSQGTASLVLLLSLGVLPFSLSIINKAVFQAWERMHYIAWANVPVHVAKAGLAFVLLRQGRGLSHLILLLLSCYVAIVGVEWLLLLRHITRPRVRIDRHFCMAMIHSTSPFLGITVIVAVNLNLDLLLLSRLTNEADVGLYSAALQLITPLIIIYETIMLSVFPEMCRRFATGLEGLKRISGRVLELLLAIALPAVIGLSFLAESAFLLLYGDTDFLLAIPALRVLVWALILWASTQVFGRALVASQRERVTLGIAVLSTLLRLTLGLILIDHFGLIGAAMAALFSALASFLLHYASVSRLLFQMPVGRLAWKPAVASACMAVCLALAKNQGFLFNVVCAGAVYVVILLILMIWSNGGPRQFRARYQYLLSR